jgi:hypothetical protein
VARARRRLDGVPGQHAQLRRRRRRRHGGARETWLAVVWCVRCRSRRGDYCTGLPLPACLPVYI